MSERRAFLQRLAVRRNLAAAALAATALRADAPARGEVTVRTFAREYAPGEIVRFVAVSSGDISDVHGTFLSLPLAFSPEGKEAPRRWVAWGVIPLDAAAGPAPFQVTAAGGAHAGGEVPIVAKTFPEQKLTVEPKFVNPPRSQAARIERERKKLAAVYARRTALPPAGEPFVRPVPGDPTSEFGTRRVFNGEPRAPHAGIDLRAATGTPVLAAGPGRVALAQDLYYSGGTIVVDHGGGLFTIYGHLSRIEAKEGAVIAAGQQIALSGATGRVTGPHLHWGARVGEAIFDPRALLDPRLFGR